MLAPTFGVVIPYYQRRAGVLAETLRSVARQDVEVPVKVVVVDDSSPIPAEDEVGTVEFPKGFDIEIIRQANAGPGVARNRGIDALASADYIAFLDSDDCWEPHHLSAALLAFEKGFDFYTAETADDEAGLLYLENFFGDELPLIPADFAPWAYELQEPLINFTVAGPIATSSTFAVRRDLIGSTRFDPALRTAGEDGLFRTELAAKSPRTLVARRVDVRLGKGVNIFTAGGWGSRAATMRAVYFLRSRIAMRRVVADFPVAKSRVEAAIIKARVEVWRAALANIRRGDFPLGSFLKLCTFDPSLVFSLGKAIRVARARGQ